MTSVANATSVAEGVAYRKKMVDVLGKRDPLAALAQTADLLEGIVKRHSAAQMRTRPFEGKWTPNEVIGHLSDCEWVYGFRLRLIYSEDEPTILGMDQDKWVAAQRLNDREPQELVEMFRQMRRWNLAIWKQLKPADLKRAGKHNERGLEPLGEMLTMLAGHDLWHLDQITRYLEAVKKSA